MSGIFLVRGAVFLPADVTSGVGDAYERLDLAVYSPLPRPRRGDGARDPARGPG